MAKIQTKEYLKKIKDWYGDRVEIIGEFRGSVRPITICYHCEKHGDTVKTLKAKNVFNRNFNPCKECLTEKKSVPHTNSKVELYKRLTEYCHSRGGKVLEAKWTFAKSIYHFKCGNPDHPIFESTADALVSGNHWCPWCSGRKGDFEAKIRNIISSKGGELISEYISASTPLKVKCLQHDYEWEITSCNLQKGRWCPICNMGLSEKAVWDWYVERKIDIRPQYVFEDLSGECNNKYRFDFAIMSNNEISYLLEIDDETHRGNSEKYKRVRESDKIKNEYCSEHDIELVRIPISYSKLRVMPEQWYREYISEKLEKIEGGINIGS